MSAGAGPTPVSAPADPTATAAPLITFLSDFGLADEFVGVVHAVLHRHARSARVVDLTHAVAPQDVRGGAFTLWRAAPWVVPGVILAVVDPGVGTARRAVAVRAGGALLVGPDNGLLFPTITRLGGPSEAVVLRPPATPPPGATFDGRDLFAPAAGDLAAGATLTDIGDPIDVSTLVRIDVPEPVAEPGAEGAAAVRAEVLWVDTFGNAQLNVTPADLDRLAPPAGAPVRLEGVAGAPELPIARSYGAIGDDPFGLVVDSYGLLSICADGRPAAAALGLAPGRVIRLCRQAATGR